VDADAETLRRIQADARRWAQDVHTAVLRQLADPARQLSPGGGQVQVPVQVVRSWTDVQGGHPILYLIYRHPWWDFTTGLRRRLDEIEQHPFLHPQSPDIDAADDLADTIVTYSVEEPLGSASTSMVPDADGVWWWGHPPLPGDGSRQGPAPGVPGWEGPDGS